MTRLQLVNYLEVGLESEMNIKCVLVESKFHWIGDSYQWKIGILTSVFPDLRKKNFICITHIFTPMIELERALPVHFCVLIFSK